MSNYKFTTVEETSDIDYGILDFHPKYDEGENKKSIPEQFTLEFWIKMAFDPSDSQDNILFGLYLYDDERTDIYENIENKSENDLSKATGIYPYISISKNYNNNNDYVFTINKINTVISKYKIENEWNHIALVYDKLNNTSCIWYLNGNCILASNIASLNMQEIINKKFCRFLWTMYKNIGYTYICKILLTESDIEQGKSGIKYPIVFNPFDRNYNEPNNTVLEYYSPIEIKPQPGQYNYKSLIHLPMQNSVTEDIGTGNFSWSNDCTYCRREENELADIIENDAYSRHSEIVKLNHMKFDDSEPVSVYLYDPDYKIDIGNAAALHMYSNLVCNNPIIFSDFNEGFTIDWFRIYNYSFIDIDYCTASYRSGSHNFACSNIESLNYLINHYLSFNNKENYYPSNLYDNIRGVTIFLNSSITNVKSKDNNLDRINVQTILNNFINRNTTYETVYFSNDTNSFGSTIMDDLINSMFNNNDYWKLINNIRWNYIGSMKNILDLYLNLYDKNYKKCIIRNPYYFAIHHALVVKPGGKIIYYENGNRIFSNIDNITDISDTPYYLSFCPGATNLFYPRFDAWDGVPYNNLMNISPIDPNYNDFDLSAGSYITYDNPDTKKINPQGLECFPNSAEKLLKLWDYVKEHREEALEKYLHLDDLIPENGTIYEQTAHKHIKYLRELNGKIHIMDFTNPRYYYTHFDFRSPNIFSHFRVTPGCLWYDNSFDPLTDTRLFVQDWDNKYNKPEQIISDIEEDNIALLYPIQSPQTIYDRRYSKSANARQDSSIQKSNFQIELLSTAPSKLTYNNEITQQGTHKPINYESYPAITTNTYKDNDNIIIFRNHHIEDKSWTVDLWVYPQININDNYSPVKVIYLSGYGIDGDNTHNEFFNTGNGILGIDIYANNSISFIGNNGNPYMAGGNWSVLNPFIINKLKGLVNVNSPTSTNGYGVSKIVNNIINFNDWNHIAISSDIDNHCLYVYINGIKKYADSLRRFSHLHRICLYTGSLNSIIKLYYTGLRVTVGQSKYTEYTISGWENC